MSGLVTLIQSKTGVQFDFLLTVRTRYKLLLKPRMTRPVSLSVIFLLMLAVTLPECNGVRFKVTPSKTVTEGVSHISFHCLPNVVNPTDIIHVRLLKLMKLVKGKWRFVASHDRIIKTVKGVSFAKRIQVHGRMTRDIKHSYLLVTITKPTPADSGTYKCIAWLKTSHHTTNDEEMSLKVTVKKRTSGAVIG